MQQRFPATNNQNSQDNINQFNKASFLIVNQN